MTRRIAIYILLTVWAMLIAGGLTAYLAVRAVLLADLDETLVARAVALPEVSANGTVSGTTAAPQEDRYLVRSEWGQTIARPLPNARTKEAELVAAQFVRVDGRSLRSVTVRVPGDDLTGPLTVIYSTPADRFNQVLQRLAWALGVCGVIGGTIAAAVAAVVARSALRPLNTVAESVGTIDEQQLDRRIDERALPRELAPVGRRLNDMLARLEQAFQQRRQFLADASHELRTPVAAMVTTLDVTFARRQQDETTFRRALEACRTNVQMLRRIVERLTDQVHHQRAANSAEEMQWIDIGELLDGCATTAEGLASKDDVQVTRSLPAMGETSVRTQPDRLRRALLNLLHNAVSYNRAGGSVHLACTQRGHDLTIEVRDTGVGIAPDQLPHVFAPFYRADAARSPTSEGHLGLGLFQVRTDVEAIGGECTITSTPGAGTTVTIRLRDCVRTTQNAFEAPGLTTRLSHSDISTSGGVI